MNNKMAINTYLSTIQSKKQNEHAKQKQTRRYREHVDSCQIGGVRGGGIGDWVKRVKGLQRTNWQLQNSHGDVKYSIE